MAMVRVDNERMGRMGSAGDRRRRSAATASVVALCAAIAGAGPAAAQSSAGAADDWGVIGEADTIAFDIVAQELDDALEAFALQSGQQLMFDPGLVEGRTAPAVRGVITPAEALAQLLDGAGVEPGVMAGEVLTLRAAVQPEPEGGGDPEETNEPFRPALREVRRTAARDGVVTERIVVTGTHIKGVAPVGSQVFVLDRPELERLGVATVQDAVRTLPQNFAGGLNAEDRRINTGGTPVNISGGAGVNLRGLGGDATLVLVNGRRLPQGAAPSGQFVDVSSIPLRAVERIEVLPDGASALYGSDAIAGVVNFVLRDDYEGAETRLRYGGVTDGSLREWGASHVLGLQTDRSNLLAGYEYFARDPLPAAERAYTADSDLSRFGGPVIGLASANPANIDFVELADGTTVSVTYAVPEGQDGSSLAPEDLIEGEINLTNTNKGRWLLARQRRHSAFATGAFDLTPAIEAFGELRYSLRSFESRRSGQTMSNVLVPSTNPFFVSPVPDAAAVRLDYNFVEDFGGRRGEGDVETLGAVAGLTAEGERLRGEVFVSYGREITTSHADLVHDDRFVEALGFDDPATPFDPAVDGFYNPFADGSVSPPGVLDYIMGFDESEQTAELMLAKALADARLFALPGGEVRLAAGVEHREERRRSGRLDFTEGPAPEPRGAESLDREVSAVFGELLVPLIGEDGGLRGLREVRLSLAGRHERYSDFGASTDPKIGLSWVPLEGLELRGAYGQSFKAPKLTDIGGDYIAAAFAVLDPTNTDTGRSLALILQGDSNTLTAETSTSWTAGFSLQPPATPGFRLAATYFDIDFEDRLGRLPISPTQVLVQEDLFASVVTRDPSPDAVATLIDGAVAFDDFANGPAITDYRVIIDARTTNIAITRVSGVDTVMSYSRPTPVGEMTLGLNASYLLEFDQAVAPSAPLASILNTLNNPIDLELRARVGLSRDRWSATGFVNYTDSYRNTSLVPEHTIDSWTTLDLNLRYELGESRSPWLDGVAASLSVQNLLDQDPPLALDAAQAVGLAYDSENADPLGRFVALQLVKSW